MAAPEEAPTSELPKEPETLEMGVDKTLESTEAQVMSENAQSSVDNNGKNAEEEEQQPSEKTLEEAAELMEKGSAAMKADDYAEAADCFSRAVEIRVAHYGELAPECSSAYYKYGCALLYKAQEEADPLGAVPKKDSTPIQDGSLSKGECSASSITGDAKQDEDSTQDEPNDATSEIQQTEADDNEDEGSDDEDESDLDLAWKMLDLARAIVEKKPEDTMEKVDILSALGEVALEREDIETSLSDYKNALDMLHRLVEPDNRQIAELNFRICLVLELGAKTEEAIPYCDKAITVCKARVERLMEEVKGSTDDSSVLSKEAEIKTINGLLGELEKKLEDLQQMDSKSNPFLPEFLKMIAAKAKGNGSSSSAAIDSSQLGTNIGGGGFDSPTLSTAHTKGSGGGGGGGESGVVQHLGVVGRGVKRVSTSSTSGESTAVKKAAVEKSESNDP